MNNSVLRNILTLFVILTVICVIWAVGANSRKKVELEKSGDLYTRVKELTQANTVITDDLKRTKNRCGDLQKSTTTLKNKLTEEREKNKSLKKDLNKAEHAHNKIAKELKKSQKTNDALGNELTKAKGKTLKLQQNLKSLKIELNHTKNQINKKRKKQPTKKIRSNQTSSDNNFDW
ncbi:MAG: hypothetical protein GY853_03020 [PVC group bacterium]|nr:hypothetical protein [PVC group bacterium]